MTISFKDKVVIVTGSGGGLGRSHALQFAERGAKLVINDLGGAVDGSGGSSEAADKVVQEIKDMGGEAISNGSSVTDKEGVQKLVDDTMSAFGRIDVLVNTSIFHMYSESNVCNCLGTWNILHNSPLRSRNKWQYIKKGVV